MKGWSFEVFWIGYISMCCIRLGSRVRAVRRAVRSCLYIIDGWDASSSGIQFIQEGYSKKKIGGITQNGIYRGSKTNI